MAKQTSKGTRHQRRASAIERKATHHHEFIGEADAERAGSELQKHERLGNLPEPAQKVLHVAESAMAVLFIPVRLGLSIALEVVRLPLNILRGMRHREA